MLLKECVKYITHSQKNKTFDNHLGASHIYKAVSVCYNYSMEMTVFKAKSYYAAGKALTEKIKSNDAFDLDTHHIVISGVKTSMANEFQILDALEGSFNTRVLTFARLMNLLLPGKNFISKQSSVMILTKVISELSGKFKCFTTSHKSEGFAETIFDTITQLKYSSISSEQLQKENLPMSLADKISDIALIYKAYESFICGKYVDNGARMNLLAEIIPTSSLIKNSFFYIKDFEYFTVQESLIIRQLVLNSKGVFFSVAALEERKYSGFSIKESIESIQNIARGLEIKINYIDVEEEKNELITQIRENLFVPENNKKPSIKMTQDKLVLQQAGNIFDETEKAAKFIKRKIFEGYRYKDVLVVVSDVDTYGYPVSQIFGEFDLTCFLDSKRCLADHGFVKFLLSALNCKKNGMMRDDAIDCVFNSFFDCHEQEKFLFENYCLKYNIKFLAKEFLLGSEEEIIAAEKVRKKLQKLILSLSIKNSDKCENHVENIRKFLSENKLFDKLGLNIKQENDCNRQTAKFSEQVEEKLEGVLQSVGEIMKESVMDLSLFCKTLENGCKTVYLSIIPLFNDCIVVSDLSKSRSQAHKILVVLGANEGVFPQIKSDTKLLSDKNISQLEQFGVCIYPKVKAENKRERFNVYELFAEPREAIFIGFISGAADSAKAALESSVVDELRRMFFLTKGCEYPIFLQDKNEDVYSRNHAKRQFVEGLRGYFETEDDYEIKHISSLYHALGEKEIDKYVYQERQKPRIKNAKKLLLPNSTVSVTKIETYFKCPYMYFLENGIKLKEKNNGEIKSFDLGNIVHEVLENFVKANLLVESLSDIEVARIARKIFSETISNANYSGYLNDNASRFAIYRLEKEIINSCIGIKNQVKNSSFKPWAQEWEFGFTDSKARPMVIKTKSGEIRLNGKIDRIDCFENFFIIIDYKSGNKVSFSEKEVYSGEKLQLLVYVKAVLLEVKKEVAGFYYLSTREKFSTERQEMTLEGRTLQDENVICKIDLEANKNKKSDLLKIKNKNENLKLDVAELVTKEEIDALLAYADLMIKTAVNSIAAGIIYDLPKTDVCKYCRYGAICDFMDVRTCGSRKTSTKITSETLLRIVKENEKNI